MSDELRQSHLSTPSRGLRASQSNPLQLVIQRLQGECETLRSEKRELERRIQHDAAKSTRAVVEMNDIQQRLLVENQKLQSEARHIKDKMREYASALEIANERIKQLDATEQQTRLRSEVLEDTVRELEALSHRQRETIESLENDVVRLNELVVQLGEERDHVLESTEADARRVRALWEETMLQHKAEITSLERAVDTSNQEAHAIQAIVSQKDTELAELRSSLAQSKVITSQDWERIKTLETQMDELKQDLVNAQGHNVQMSQSLQRVAMQVEEQASKLRSTEEKLHVANKQIEDDQRAAQTRQEELQRVLDELDGLKTEFAACLEEHECTIRKLEHCVHAKTSKEEKLQDALEAERRHSTGMSTLLASHIRDYNRILASVDNKLSDLRDTCVVPESSPQPIRVSKRPTPTTSLSIFAH
ncbi:hypothetical protein AeMF1_020904 [Aphanomyces euteiches]|nr:hypothetical protein AeMF1_020904 [Aphanomyces euteiches]KAH9188620.1 hypothetical protein AeNC1_009403 [Aphanomyces euteiches]